MHIAALGSIALGFVWGWLIGSLREHIWRLWRSNLAVMVATLIFVLEVSLFANWHMLLPVLFLGAAFFSLLLHLLWRCQLHHRFDHLEHPH